MAPASILSTYIRTERKTVFVGRGGSETPGRVRAPSGRPAAASTTGTPRTVIWRAVASMVRPPLACSCVAVVSKRTPPEQGPRRSRPSMVEPSMVSSMTLTGPAGEGTLVTARERSPVSWRLSELSTETDGPGAGSVAGAEGEGEGEGEGLGEGEGVGDGLGAAVTVGDGDGVAVPGEGEGEGLGGADGEIDGTALGLGSGVGARREEAATAVVERHTSTTAPTNAAAPLPAQPRPLLMTLSLPCERRFSNYDSGSGTWSYQCAEMVAEGGGRKRAVSAHHHRFQPSSRPRESPSCPRPGPLRPASSEAAY